MKKVLILAVLALTMSILLTACGTFTCDTCKKESDGIEYKATLKDTEVSVCEDCFNKIQNGVEKFGDVANDVADTLGLG